ncbi:hypothetical protein B0H10DRAFT_1955489 [Mycena sp. CBHHK59/15]|nr:hypothetical protein B0H10DRAFT_1955489 [Mycena sp. CBHHK59/15]
MYFELKNGTMRAILRNQRRNQDDKVTKMARIQPSEKHCKNACAMPINCSIYSHEKSTLDKVLDTAIQAVGRDDQTLKFKIVGQALRTTRFTVTWTISHTNFKGMQLASEDSFKELVKQVMLKAKVEVKLEITESELEALLASMVILSDTLFDR